MTQFGEWWQKVLAKSEGTGRGQKVQECMTLGKSKYCETIPCSVRVRVCAHTHARVSAELRCRSISDFALEINKRNLKGHSRRL